MPIKGLTEIVRMTRGGYLRLGKKNEQRGYPEKSDHFIADFEGDEDTEALFYRLYGDKPKRISIAFPSNDPDVFFPQWFKAYGKGTGLKCRGDGETAMRAMGNGVMQEFPCVGPELCEFAKANSCKRQGSIQFFIKGLPGIQVRQINTTSWNSIVNLNSGIAFLSMLRGGKIAGVWVDLLLTPQQAQANGKAVNIFVLKLDIPVQLSNAPQLECGFTIPQLAHLPEVSDERDEYLYPSGIADGSDPISDIEISDSDTALEGIQF